jgi:hypothetical protein
MEMVDSSIKDSSDFDSSAEFPVLPRLHGKSERFSHVSQKTYGKVRVNGAL